MKIGFPGGSRPMPWDRNPADRSLNSGTGTVGPHSNTIRSTYTVPAGRKAIIHGQFLEIIRIAAAAPVGLAFVETSINGARFLPMESLDNTPNLAQRIAIPDGRFLAAGDLVDVTTGDASVGGTNRFMWGVLITEFDA